MCLDLFYFSSKGKAVCARARVCMCVLKRGKKRGREIGRVYSTVSSYHIRVKPFQLLILKSLRMGNKLFLWLFKLVSPKRSSLKVGTQFL